MRRKQNEIIDLDDIYKVIDKCSTIRLAMALDGKPYMVALNFGYDRTDDGLILYFHSAAEGQKLDILRQNPEIYFQMDTGHEYIRGDENNTCSFSWHYESVAGSGRVEFVTDEEEKTHALNKVIEHLEGVEKNFSFPSKMLSLTCVFKAVCTDFTGKRTL